jgi:ribose transport system substrate-binding protein
MMVKRTAGVVGVSIAAMGLVACGSDSGSGTGTGTASSGGKSITFIAGNKTNGFYINMSCGVEAAAKKAGVSVKSTGPTEFNPTAQLPVIQAAAASNPKAVIIGPTDAKALIGPLKQLQASGAKIVIVDQDVDDASIGVSRISSNNEEGGRQAADAMAKLIGGKGKVLVLDIAPGSQASGARAEGFKAQIADKYPDIEIVGTQYDQSDPTRAASIVSSTLAAHPDLAGVFADANQGALGSVTALRNAGKTGDVKLVGFDGDPAEIEALKKGQIDALVTQQPYQIGADAVDAAVAALDGKTPEAKTATPTTLVTPENVDDPEVSKYFYTSECS